MKKIMTIMWKEIRDNLRDRRSLFFALVYSPILMPALMVGPIIFNANKHIQSYEQPSTIHVFGEERAPNLLKYLYSKNIDARPAGNDFLSLLEEGDIDIVLEISESYPERFVSGKPARLTIHYDKENSDSQRLFWKLRETLQVYARSIAAGRMVVRGMSQQLLHSIDVIENDISEEDMQAGIIAKITMFLAVFAMIMGGIYLAIDTTAGEREHGTLEPLLSLAVTRAQVATGKYLAVLAWVTVSFVLPIINVGVLSQFIPEGFYGNAETPTLSTFVKIFVLAWPLSLLMTSLLMAIGAASRSVKEAQTQIGIATLLPLIPFFVVQFMNIKLTAKTALIPVLSQYLMADKIVTDPGFAISAMLPSIATTLLVALLLLFVTIRQFQKESILG